MWETKEKDRGVTINILLAGGAGFIGSHLADALLSAGHFVVVVDNFRLGNETLIGHNLNNPNFVFYNCDINDENALDYLFRQHSISRVYHLAANSDIQKGGNNPSIDYHDTFSTTISLLNVMRKYAVKELLFTSTSAVYGDNRTLLSENTGPLLPISYYGGAKLASEAFISAFTAMNEMKTVIIRFPNVVGPRLTHGVIFDFIGKLRKNPGELEILGDGKQEKPYIYVLDLIDAILSMHFDGGINVFNAGVTTSTTVSRIADIVCEEMGLENVNYWYSGGAIGWLGDVPKFQYDLTKIHNHGWIAKHTSDEAVRLATRHSL